MARLPVSLLKNNLLMRMFSFALPALMLVAPAFGQSEAETAPEQPAPRASLAETLRREIDEARLGARTQIGIHVVEVPTRKTVVDIQADAPRRPASLMKLATVAAALEMMGPAETFTTRIETDGVIDKGVLYGDLIIVGGGDPTLGPRFSRNPSNVAGILDQWALELRQKGIRRIDGNILGDGTRYTNDRLSPYWDTRDAAEWYNAEVSALAFNDNVHDILWKAGGSTGSRVDFEVIPPTGYFAVNSSVRVGAPGQVGSRIRLFRFPESTEIRARGSLPPRTRKFELAAMHDPAAWTAHLMMERLRARGIRVEGTALNRGALTEFRSGETTDTLTLISHDSPPLSEILPIVLGESQNLYAEMLLREVALLMLEEPSFVGGSAALTRWLRNRDLHRTGFLAVDGSGLAGLNRMTARQVTDILLHMQSSRHRFLWRESLATPGTRSMRTRLTGSQFAALRDRVQAKTGYVTGAHTLAGYLKSPLGTDYVFAIMITDYDPMRSLVARDLLDKLVLVIDESPETP